MGQCLVIVLTCASVACAPDRHPVAGEPGTPIPGVSEVELARFHAGRALFERVYLAEEGLGPPFNENQCSACHTEPAAGGTTGFERVVKATRFEGPGRCDALTNDGGENIRTQVTPLLRAHGVERELIPSGATEVGRFSPPFLFGLGLVEAIPDEEILAREDSADANGDGISGRVGRTADGRLARFGRKAEFATIEEFIEGALRLEMGLTTPARPEEVGINGKPLPLGTDPAVDPEVDQAAVDLLTAFVQYLAPPAQSVPRTQAQADTIDAGQQLFHEIGCVICHTPSLRTGFSATPALAGKTVRLYSDLLLHDTGRELADVCGASASPAEIRTEMLMGLRHRDRYLHDGRANELTDAILAHGGEAQRARDAFAALPYLRQYYVLAFLRSL